MTTLTVTGMTCGGCEQNVVDALEALDGVERVTADHEANVVTVEGDADPLDLIAAVPEQYEVESTD
ncbi:heavy-metal-associated domain-containing protein [Halobaculum litoreum]|uniref:Heavy-metal-associated domain-containing protein n=1 Tax=Halobaculum litoreum TaxID=3031998 RepID=A0ABD5XQL2_9EURY|nr:heavy metal-associated domain-containing protein [Halobaculum sp. DT92]